MKCYVIKWIIIGYSTVFCKIRDFICLFCFDCGLTSRKTIFQSGILFARVFVLQKSNWTSDSESNAISVERRRVQIKTSILPNTVE